MTARNPEHPAAIQAVLPQADDNSLSVAATAPVPPAPSDIDRANGVAVWRQIAEDLRSEIETGRLPPGARLPTEVAMAEHYSVNRHTLRRAIAELARAGLVTATPRLGTFVADRRIAYPIGARTRFSENVASLGRAPGGRLLSWRETNAPEAMSDWLGLARRSAVIELEHLRSADDVPVCVATAWFPADRFSRIATLYQRLGSITRALDHLKVVGYRRKRTRISSALATPEERDLLNLERGAIVLITDTLDVDAVGEPIQVSRTRFAADRVDFLIES